jgi:hypothetical protein
MSNNYLKFKDSISTNKIFKIIPKDASFSFAKKIKTL